MALRRGNYDITALHHHGSGRYRYRRGFNLVGLGWFLAGIVLAALFASSAVYVGPLTGLVGGGDISIFIGFGVALAGYYLTMRRRIGGPDGTASPDVDETAGLHLRTPMANEAGAA